MHGLNYSDLIGAILRARVFRLLRLKCILGNYRPTRQPQPFPHHFKNFYKVSSLLGILPKFHARSVPLTSQLQNKWQGRSEKSPLGKLQSTLLKAPFKIHRVKATSRNSYEVRHLAEFSRQVSSLLPSRLMMLIQ